MNPMKENAMKPVRLLIAVLAAAALAAVLSPGSRAAPATGYYQLNLDGIDVGLFERAEQTGERMTLRRGVASRTLAAWAARGDRRDVEVRLVGASGVVLRRWRLDDALPSKWELAELDASKNEVAIETLELVS
jgi:hypothetical protein